MTHASRRALLGLAAAAPLLAAAPLTSTRIKAVAFDGFPIIDPRPVAARAEQLFPGRGGELIDAWRTRQFEYTWLRTLTGRYADFWQVTEEALLFAAEQLKLELDAERRRQLMQTFLELKAWPDAAAALERLHEAGLRLAFLSNFTVQMLETATRNSGLAHLLEAPLSTDRAGAYKPDPRAYQTGLDAFGLAKQDILFVASAGWDAAGAKAFGYPTFWVNRQQLPAERLGVAADGVGAGMADLVRFVLG